MSHLGDLLSALVDGELAGAELDRANAHLAGCAVCQAEAQALRRLKDALHALPAAGDAGAITRRLLALPAETGSKAGPGAGPGTGARSADPVPAPARQSERGRGTSRRTGRARPHARPGAARPHSAFPLGRAAGRRGRYVLWSTVSLVVVGIGTAAFGMGGSEGAPEPQITPQLQVFDFQHAITSGDVPFADPSEVSPRVPVASAKP